VDTALVRRVFHEFLTSWVASPEQFEGLEAQMDLDPSEPLYKQYLQKITITNKPFLELDCKHLKSFNFDLYRQIIHYPEEIIPTFDTIANDYFFETFARPDTVLPHRIQVFPFNVEKVKNMRKLNPKDIDKLLTIEGMVVRTSPINPDMATAFFQCEKCNFTVEVDISKGRINEPNMCGNCKQPRTMSIIHNRSLYTTRQMWKVQESPDDMPPGQTPHSITMQCFDSLVDAAQPGDRVTITGIYRAQQVRSAPRARVVKTVCRTFFDVVHCMKATKGKLHEKRRETQEDNTTAEAGQILSDDRIEQIKQLSQQPNTYERLAEQIAPAIWENSDIKKGLLLLLVGASRKDLSKAGRSHFRSEVHVLLCGDPGTSKSQLLQYVYRLVPRGQYTSGKGSSAVGLTAYIMRDPDTRELLLQPGALVLADNGVCCIDEFDKMTDQTRSILHEVMEQQTLSITKAGIICRLNARSSVLAAANPIESSWNPKKTIIENIQLPHTLLSRFDLIFLVLDPRSKEYDQRLARHLISLYHNKHDDSMEDSVHKIDQSLLRDYIGYCRSNINPVLSDKARAKLVQLYVEMRQSSVPGSISAYPRQLESMIRLAEAHAKLRLSEEVSEDDVEEARRLYNEALKQSAINPRTGHVDVEILTTGVSTTARKQLEEMKENLKKMIDVEKRKGPNIRLKSLLDKWRSVSEVPITNHMFDEVVRLLQDDEFVVRTGDTIRIQ